MTDQSAHVVREQTVKAHMLKSQLVMTPLQLRLPVSAQSYGRMIASNRVLPGMLERRGHCR